MFDNITNYEVDFSEFDKSDHSFDQKITKSNKRSIILTCFNTFRSFVAIGILSLPYAVMLVGPLIGFLGLIFIAVLIYISFKLLLEIADDSKFKGSNFETLGKLIWGKPG
jgi:amino acid permease